MMFEDEDFVAKLCPFLYTVREWTVAVGIMSSPHMIDFVDLCSFTL